MAGNRDDGPSAAGLRAFDLVIFDCDGVLVDSELLSCSCLAEMLCEHGFPIDLQGVFDAFLGRGFGAVEERYREVTGRPLGADFIDAHRRRLMRGFAALRPVPGVEAVLDGLDRPFCVASSSERDRLAYTLRAGGLEGRFATRNFSAGEVARGKPAPDLFLHAAARMRVRPSATLVIEDSVNGVRAGKAAGMTVWGFVGGSHYAGRDGARMLAEAGSDHVFASMGDLLEPARRRAAMR